MTPARPKEILILAGPNGAGKTTFAREFLQNEANVPTFINADLIAAGLSPFKPDLVAFRAGRLMVQLIRGHVARGGSFAFETTLADRGFARWILKWQAEGYRVSLWFLALGSVDMAVERVAQRVLQGGHGIAEHDIRRRFIAGQANFEAVYKPLVDTWTLYDNSGSDPILLDWGERR